MPANYALPTNFNSPLTSDPSPPGLLDPVMEFFRKIRSGQGSWLDFMNLINRDDNGTFLLNNLDSNPEGAYGAYAGISGTQHPGRYGNWLNNQYPRYSAQWNVLKGLSSGAFRPSSAMSDASFNPYHDFNFSSPFERGERPNVYAPTSRMVR